ncbi:MAG: bifunctional metallophosphatase/5'-nucleotidase [Bacteroidales bacterium]|nr:bifunctional metallophosphatase/5'-nucleotidase [Bacteroidales bacterium]
MRKKILFLLLFAAFALPVVSCGKESPVAGGEQPPEPPVEKPRAGEYVLPLIETTDMHGYVVSTDADGSVHFRLAYIADKADDIRGHGEYRRTDLLLLLDGGDLYQGASISNLMSGWPVYVAMDMMQYDAVAMGNHEFDWGIENIVDADATLPDYEWKGSRCIGDVPILCANLYKDGERVSFTRDYVVVEKTALGPWNAFVPVRIGIVGFAIDYAGSILSTQFTDQGYSIAEDYSIANNIAAELESSGECDATILLVHGEAEGVAEKLGSGSSIDLVLGGHSHRYLEGTTVRGIPYLQGGRYCERYASADLRFEVDGEGAVSFKSVDNRAIHSVVSSRDTHTSPGENSADLSDEILAVSDAALAATAPLMNEVIGYIGVGATTYYINGSGERAATMSNWMCDIIRRIGHADVAFVNAGGIRTSFPLSGQSRRDITAANIYEMFPFGNKVYVYSITYADLLKVFEYSMTSGGQSLFSRMTGLDCYFTAVDHGSYSTYAVHSLRKDGTVIYSGGTWTGDWASRTVTLAASEYIATGERTDYYTGLPNPLIEWNSTEKLLSNNQTDNEGALRVLREEAAASAGHLYIDTSAHFLLTSQ